MDENDEGCVICLKEDYEEDNMIVYCAVSLICKLTKHL